MLTVSTQMEVYLGHIVTIQSIRLVQPLASQSSVYCIF